MRFHIFPPLLISIMLLTACGTVEFGVETTPTPNQRLTQTVSALIRDNLNLETQLAQPTRTRNPGTPSPTLASAETPTPSSTASASHFTNLRFSVDPEASLSQHFYVAGVPRIYGTWDYANMHPGAVIRRVWMLNGVEWISREEIWDYDTFGANGRRKDISIFSENMGLQAGEYSLQLYIDGVQQEMASSAGSSSTADPSKFWIFPSQVNDPVTSPDKTYTAWVKNGGRLMIEDPDGKNRELVSVQEIASLEWLPDSQHILYAERDRTKQIDPTEDWGITHKLWILDVVTGEHIAIGTAGENFHNPQISPNGKFIAVLAGSTYNNGCQISPSLVFIQLDESLHRSAIIQLNKFANIDQAGPEGSGIYPSNPSNPGHWENDDQYMIGLSWVCFSTNNPPDGVYLLDLGKLVADKIG